jgi:S-adenosylmethionine uptake transporter
MALLWFWGLARVPIAEAIALTFIAPIMAIFLAGLMLGERIRPAALVGSMLGLAGVMVMLAPRLGAGFGDGALAGACSILGFALLYALNLVLIRKQAQSVSPTELAFFQNLINLFFLSLAAPFFASFPTVAQLPAILASAALALVSLMLLSWAYARAQAQSLVSVEYTGFGWGALYGWLVFGEAVGPWLLAGTLLIVAGCILAARSPRGPQEIAAEGTL